MIVDAVAVDPLGPGATAWGKATAQLRTLLSEQMEQGQSLLDWSPP